MTTEEVKVSFTADIEDFKKDMSSISKGIKDMNKTLTEISKVFKDIAKPIKDMSQGIGELSKKFGNLNTTMNDSSQVAQKESRSIESVAKATQSATKEKEKAIDVANKGLATTQKEIDKAKELASAKVPKFSVNNGFMNGVQGDIARAKSVGGKQANIGADLGKSVAEYEKSVTKAREHHTALTQVSQQLDIQRQKVENATQKYNEQKRKLDELVSQQERMSRVFKELKIKGTVGEELSRLKTNLEVAEQKAMDLENTMLEMSRNGAKTGLFGNELLTFEQMESKLVDLNEDIEIAENKFNALSNAIQGVSGRLMSMQPSQALDKLEGDIGQASAKLEQMDIACQTGAMSLDRLESKQAQASAKFRESSSTMETNKAKVIGLRNALGGLSTANVSPKIANMNARLQKMGNSVNSATAKCQRGVSKVRNFFNSISNGSKKISGAVSKLNIFGNTASRVGGKLGGFGRKFGQTMMMMKSIILSMLLMNVFQIIGEGIEDYAKKNEKFNATMSKLSSSFSYLKSSMISAFAPLIEMVLPIITNIVNAIAEGLNQLNAFFSALSGKSTYTKAIYEQKDYKESLEDSKNANEELKKSILGFDNINKINDTSGSGGSSSGGGTWVEEEVPISKFADMIKNGEWGKVGEELAKKLNKVFKDVGWEELGNKVGGYINNMLNIAKGFVTTFEWGDVGTSFAEYINGLNDTVEWETLGETITASITGVCTLVSKFIQTVDWIDLVDSVWRLLSSIKVEDILSGLAGLLGSIFGAIETIKLRIGGKIADIGKGIVDYLKEKLAKNLEKTDGNLLLAMFMSWFDVATDVYTWIYEKLAKPFLDGVLDAFSFESDTLTSFKELGESITEFIALGLNNHPIVQKFNEIKAKIKEKFNDFCVKWGIDIPTTAQVKEWFTARAKEWKTKTSNFMLKAGNTIANVKEWFKNRSAVWTGKTVAFNIKANTKVEELKKSFKSAINTVIKWINKYIIDSLNTIKIKIPEIKIGGFKFGGQTFGFDLKHIESFKDGGFPSGENGLFFANSSEMVGKFTNGRTAVANNYQIVEGIEAGVYKAVTSALTQNKGNGQTFNVYVGGKEVTDVVIKDINNRTIAYGKCPILV